MESEFPRTVIMPGEHALVKKVQEGREWRGQITVEDDGEEYELTVRNMTSPELEDVLRLINRDELSQLQDELPQDEMEERRELLAKDEDERTDEEEARLETLNEELKGEHMKLFDILSEETFDGIRLAAEYGVVPSKEYKEDALRNRAHEIEEETGARVRQLDDVHDYLKDELIDAIVNSTRFIAFQVGMKVLRETGENEGN